MNCIFCNAKDAELSIIQTNIQTRNKEKIWYCDKDCFYAHQIEYHTPILEKEINGLKELNKELKNAIKIESRLNKLYRLNFADILFSQALLARKPKNELYHLLEIVVEHRKKVFEEMENATHNGDLPEGILLEMGNKFKPEVNKIEKNWIEFFGV